MRALLLLATVWYSLFAQNQGGGISSSSSGGPPTGAAGGALTGTYPNPGISSGSATAATCAGSPGNTTGAYKSQCQATTSGNLYVCNNPAGCSVAADWVAVGSAITALSSAVYGTPTSNKLRDFVSILDYGAVSNVSVNTNVATTVSSTSVTISGLTSANIGQPIVFFTPNTVNEFQTTISNVSGSTVTLAGGADVTASGRTAYWGTDSTGAIDSAISAAQSQGKCLYIPAGSWFYQGNGTGTWGSPCVWGEGMTNSGVYLGVGSYFVTSADAWYSMLIRDLEFFGGAGGIRQTGVGNDIEFQKKVMHVLFQSYSGAALSDNSSDTVYWDVTGSTFFGLNTIASIGVAILGSDQGNIYKNAFLNNFVHVKLGKAGSSLNINDNDFIEFSAEATQGSYRRASIWIVPSPSLNGNSGLKITGNKFGNENLDPSDVRVLIADTVASSGSSYFGDTTFKTTASTAAAGFDFKGNNVVGSSFSGYTAVNPIVYSYTPAIEASTIDATLAGTNPGSVIQFDSSVTEGYNSLTTGNVFGPFTTQTSLSNFSIISGAAGYGVAVSDPNAFMAAADPNVITSFPTGTSLAGFANLFSVLAPSLNANGSTKATITDASGGTNAITVTVTGTGQNNDTIFGYLSTTPVFNSQGWVELDLRQGSSGTSISSVYVGLCDQYGNPCIGNPTITLSATWHRYKLPFVLRSALPHGSPIIAIGVLGGNQNTTFDVGRINVYTSTEPVSGGMFLQGIQAPSLTSTGSAPTISSGTIVGTTLAGVITAPSTGTYTFTMTFPTTAPNRYVCSFRDETTTSDVVGSTQATAPTTTTLTATGTVVSGDKISYSCIAY